LALARADVTASSSQTLIDAASPVRLNATNPVSSRHRELAVRLRLVAADAYGNWHELMQRVRPTGTATWSPQDVRLVARRQQR
jgi:hypothetical protein